MSDISHSVIIAGDVLLILEGVQKIAILDMHLMAFYIIIADVDIILFRMLVFVRSVKGIHLEKVLYLGGRGPYVNLMCICVYIYAHTHT